MTTEEALAVAHSHYEEGVRWLQQRGKYPSSADEALFAAAHFSAGQFALAIAAAEQALNGESDTDAQQ